MSENEEILKLLNELSELNFPLPEHYYNIAEFNENFEKVRDGLIEALTGIDNIPNALEGQLFNNLKTLKVSSNLNSIEDGLYKSGVNAEVSTYTNCPTSTTFILINSSNKQLLIDESNIYYRSKTALWNSWEQAPTRKDMSNKVDKVHGKGLSDKNFTTAYSDKLDGIEENANNYKHPASHSAEIIDETEERKFVSQSEKDSWDGQIQQGRNIVIKATDWLFNEENNFYEANVIDERIKATDCVSLDPHIETLYILEEAGAKQSVKTYDGYVKIFAIEKPEGDAIVDLNLNRGGEIDE